MGQLRIGTSGWNYPTGRGTWTGIFYPAADTRPKRFDELVYYAERFDTVEVNSTFYGQPRAEVAASWVRRTPPGFEFSLKLYRKFTHPEMFKQAAVPGLPPGAVPPDVLDELARVTPADLDAFRRGIDPIASAGRLGMLLAQFPPSFKQAPATVAYLEWLLRAFDGYPMAVELRHGSWSDHLAGTLTLLNGFGAAWVQIDEPKFLFSIRQNELPNVPAAYYMRLHGRNAAAWWRHAAAEDRYDYLYSADEMDGFARTIDAAGRLVKKLYVYQNNHFAAKAPANALMLKRRLGLPTPGTYPPAFVERYPELASYVAVATPSPASRTSS
ncbi:MAG: DUF72 domain-containing protein [Acidobacteriota bacterium]|nr:DUF72 domain-containing protein [Acidobacteriota bacterium]